MNRRTESGNRFNAAQSKVVSANKKPEESVKEQKNEEISKNEDISDVKIETSPSAEEGAKAEEQDEMDIETIQKSSKNTSNIFSKQKKEHGVQQSVYLKKEVYDYCERISEKHGIKFSDVINTIVLEYMDQN